MRKDKLITLVLILAGGILIVNLTGSIWRLWQQDKPLKEMGVRLEELKEENAELKKKKAYINSERFFEEQARDKLNLGKEGEAIVILPKEVIEDISKMVEKEQEKTGEGKPNWQKWIEIFW